MHGLTGRKAALGLGIAVSLLVGGVYGQNALGDLGVSEASAKQEVVRTFADGYVPWHLGAKAFKAAAPALRVTSVKGAIAWAKAYTETPAFKAEYDRRRAEDAPRPPQVKGTADDQLAKQRAEQKKQIEEMRANIVKMPAEMRKQMEETVKQVEAQFASQEQNAQMTAMMKQSFEMQAAADQKAYEGRVAAHEKRYPADPKVLIARRLNEFLAMSGTVDFGAKLQARGGRMVFANPVYEEKPPEWKLCYRAGREAVEAARASAAEWLKALGAK